MRYVITLWTRGNYGGTAGEMNQRDRSILSVPLEGIMIDIFNADINDGEMKQIDISILNVPLERNHDSHIQYTYQ